MAVSHQIGIRTAKFLENFTCSENYICTLCENKADSNFKENLLCSWQCHVVTILELVWARVKCHCYYVLFAFFS